jgi:hypothetical protein
MDRLEQAAFCEFRRLRLRSAPGWSQRDQRYQTNLKTRFRAIQQIM